jgi:hypothetical protein
MSLVYYHWLTKYEIWEHMQQPCIKEGLDPGTVTKYAYSLYLVNHMMYLKHFAIGRICHMRVVKHATAY